MGVVRVEEAVLARGVQLLFGADAALAVVGPDGDGRTVADPGQAAARVGAAVVAEDEWRRGVVEGDLGDAIQGVVAIGADLAARVAAGEDVAGGVVGLCRRAAVGAVLRGEVAEAVEGGAGDEVFGVGDGDRPVLAVVGAADRRADAAAGGRRLQGPGEAVEGVVAVLGDQAARIGDGGEVALRVVAVVGGGVLLRGCGAGEEESEENGEDGAEGPGGAGRGDAVGDCVAGITISDTVPEILLGVAAP